jgi:hypothetical protein
LERTDGHQAPNRGSARHGLYHPGRHPATPRQLDQCIEDEVKRPERQHNDIRFFDHRWRYCINGGRDEIQVRRIAHVTSGYGSPARVAGLDPA